VSHTTKKKKHVQETWNKTGEEKIAVWDLPKKKNGRLPNQKREKQKEGGKVLPKKDGNSEFAKHQSQETDKQCAGMQEKKLGARTIELGGVRFPKSF